jgi:hypothetical protein
MGTLLRGLYAEVGGDNFENFKLDKFLYLA